MTSFEIGAEFGDPMTDSEANAQGLLSTEQVSILTGVPVEELRAEFHRQRGGVPKGQVFTFRMPKDWVRRGKERTALSRVSDMGHAMQVLQVIDDPSGRWVDGAGAVWSATGEGDPGAPLLATRGSVTQQPVSGLAVQRVVVEHGPLRRIGGAR